MPALDMMSSVNRTEKKINKTTRSRPFWWRRKIDCKFVFPNSHAIIFQVPSGLSARTGDIKEIKATVLSFKWAQDQWRLSVPEFYHCFFFFFLWTSKNLICVAQKFTTKATASTATNQIHQIVPRSLKSTERPKNHTRLWQRHFMIIFE